MRWWRRGDPLLTTRFFGTGVERVLRSSVREDRGYVTPCLIFIGCGDGDYATVSADGRTKSTYLVMWEHANGPVPKGMHLHHLCKQPRCCEVTHLALRTPKDHKAEHRKTHCRHGHEMTPENTGVGTQKGGGLARWCRACNREKNRRYNARRR